MESASLLLNEKLWYIRPLGEKAWLLEPGFEGEILPEIHTLQAMLERGEVPGLTEIVPAYASIALIFEKEVQNLEMVLQSINDLAKGSQNTEVETQVFEIPVCFELGLDWADVTVQTGLTKEEVIRKFESEKYTVAMMGFLPGFIFLEGLDPLLSVPRKRSPRTNIPPGSVGIGGKQTGIYSIESPGGWNIIGRTANMFFDPRNDPPMKLNPGDELQFRGISKEEYFKLSGGSEDG